MHHFGKLWLVEVVATHSHVNPELHEVLIRGVLQSILKSLLYNIHVRGGRSEAKGGGLHPQTGPAHQAEGVGLAVPHPWPSTTRL